MSQCLRGLQQSSDLMIKATAIDLIIPSALAFVSQTTGIQNASFNDNILFGFSYDEIRL